MSEQHEQMQTAMQRMGFTPGLIFEIIERALRIEEDGGFGCVSVVMKAGRVYKLSHTVDGKPTVIKSESIGEIGFD